MALSLRRICLYLTILLSIVVVLLFGLVTSHTSQHVEGLLARIKASGKESEAPPSKPDFYQWKTRSSFEPVQFADAHNVSTAELCASFPASYLNGIVPVLKTGHGVLEQRVRPQLDAGLACLENLLTFSDVTEHFENLHLIDVLEDIPQKLIDSDDQLEPYRRLQKCVATGAKDCGDVVTHKEAWQMDKFKFLPMATRAWKMRPERRWYVFFEADTMVFWDNVFRLLGNFDPDVALYFGSPSPGRAETWFAYGGAGFILSREAMRRLISHDWDSKSGEYLGSKLTETHWHTLLNDCCGDSVLGWALHEAGVDLGGLWPSWSPHPPHGTPFADLYWCQPPIGLHKPSVKDVQGLFRWEYEARQYDRPLLYRDLALSYYNFTSLTRKTAWDNAGWDAFGAPSPSKHYSEDPTESPDACGAACEAHPECMQWTHHGQDCTFVRSIRFGRSRTEQSDEAEETHSAKGGRYVAGWATDRIADWIAERPCDEVQWVTPSLKRIF